MNARKLLRKGLLVTAGTVSVGVGIAGIFLPLLPATPFLLFAAACYVRSSDKLYRWLLSNRVTASYIANYRAGNGIPARAKVVSICVLWITLAISASMVQIWWVWVILGAVAVGVPLYILSLPTLQSGEQLTVEPEDPIGGAKSDLADIERLLQSEDLDLDRVREYFALFDREKELDALLAAPEGFGDDVPIDPNFHARRLPDRAWRDSMRYVGIEAVIQPRLIPSLAF
jgi:uncharacterized membrane protein YbaN (DUF454 family)